MISLLHRFSPELGHFADLDVRLSMVFKALQL